MSEQIREYRHTQTSTEQQRAADEDEANQTEADHLYDVAVAAGKSALKLAGAQTDRVLEDIALALAA